MAQPRNKAVIAGLAAALTLGGVTLPAVATTSNTTTSDSDPNGMGTPLPSDYDKSDYYEGTEGTSTFASTRSASTLSPVSLTDEMKYFTLYESGRNYDKGLSSGDGYNAVGYYQFDRRYALVPFLRQVYAYNPQTYSMFAPVLAQASTLASESYSMYDYNTRQLTALAQQLNEAWHAAYAANPAEFSALQDSYAYNNYYLPVQSMLINTYGVDLRNRADCVKGLAWSMCNLFGQGGVQKFFKGANLSNDMTDRELVTALCDTVINHVAEWYPSQPQYHAGWQNRFRKEKAQCLKYIEQHEAEQNAGGEQGVGGQQGDAPSADGPSAGDAGAGDQGFGSTDGASGSDAPNADDGTAGGATNQPSTPPAANGAGSSDAPNSTPDADAGSSEGTAGGSNVESGSSGGESAGSGSAQGGEEGAGSGAASDGAAGGSSSAGSTAGGSSASGGASGGAGSGAGQDASGGSSSSAQGSGAAGGSSSAGTGAAGDGSTAEDKQTDAGEKDGGDDKQTTDTTATQSEEGSSTDAGDTNKASKTTSNAQGSAAKKTSAGDLPLTGDDTALVMTGAVGLAVAGASFLSLAKKENAPE